MHSSDKQVPAVCISKDVLYHTSIKDPKYCTLVLSSLDFQIQYPLFLGGHVGGTLKTPLVQYILHARSLLQKSLRFCPTFHKKVNR